MTFGERISVLKRHILTRWQIFRNIAQIYDQCPSSSSGMAHVVTPAICFGILLCSTLLHCRFMFYFA